MGLLNAECLHDETAIDRLAPWSPAELDDLTAGLLREPPPEDGDPLPVPELLNVQQPRERLPDCWFELELGLFRALVTHEN